MVIPCVDQSLELLGVWSFELHITSAVFASLCFYDKHMMKRYVVVEFTDDSSVEVAPCTWVEGNICFWPPYRN